MTRVPLFWDDAIQEHKGAIVLICDGCSTRELFLRTYKEENKRTRPKKEVNAVTWSPQLN
jgi:hypothetical protein